MVLLLLLLLLWWCCCGIVIIAIVFILLTEFLQGAAVHMFNFVLTIFKKDTIAQSVTYIHYKHY